MTSNQNQPFNSDSDSRDYYSDTIQRNLSSIQRQLTPEEVAWQNECDRRRPVLAAWQAITILPWSTSNWRMHTIPERSWPASFLAQEAGWDPIDDSKQQWMEKCSRQIKAFADAASVDFASRPPAMLESVAAADPHIGRDQLTVDGEIAGWKLIITAQEAADHVVAAMIDRLHFDQQTPQIPWWTIFAVGELPNRFFEDDPLRCPTCGNPWPIENLLWNRCDNPCGSTRPKTANMIAFDAPLVPFDVTGRGYFGTNDPPHCQPESATRSVVIEAGVDLPQNGADTRPATEKAASTPDLEATELVAHEGDSPPKFLGLRLDKDTFSLSRDGYEMTIVFQSRKEQWEVLRKLVRAGEQGLSKEGAMNIERERSTSAWRSLRIAISDSIEPLGLEIPPGGFPWKLRPFDMDTPDP